MIKGSWKQIEDTARKPGGLEQLWKSFRICKWEYDLLINPFKKNILYSDYSPYITDDRLFVLVFLKELYKRRCSGILASNGFGYCGHDRLSSTFQFPSSFACFSSEKGANSLKLFFLKVLLPIFNFYTWCSKVYVMNCKIAQ